jgi:hypothetical protein
MPKQNPMVRILIREERRGVRPVRCACCGTDKKLVWDHIIPLSNGGSNRRENLQRLCRRCNASKSVFPSCRIDHSMENINDSDELDTNAAEQQSTAVNQRLKDDSAVDGLIAFNTRLSIRTKDYLMKSARRRGVAAGMIVEDIIDKHLHDQTPDILAKLAQLEVSIALIMTTLTHISGQAPPAPTIGVSPSEAPGPFAHRRPDYVPPDEIDQVPEPERAPEPRRWSIFGRRR